MFINILGTSLLQIFCKIILNFQVYIVKSIIDPDDECLRKNGLRHQEVRSKFCVIGYHHYRLSPLRGSYYRGTVSCD